MLASNMPKDTVLLKDMNSKMIREDFQSIKESMLSSSSPTD